MRLSNQQIIDALRDVNGMVYLAARKLGCAPNTIYNRMAKSPAIRQACDDARGEMIDISEQKLRQAVLNGEPWAISLVLKTIGKHRGYVERQEVAGDGILEITISYEDQDKITGPSCGSAIDQE